MYPEHSTHIKRSIPIGLGYILFPQTILHAQSGPDLTYITAAIGSLNSLVSTLVPLLLSVALLVFIWSVIQFIGSAHDADARSQGVRRMVWGIVGLFAIVSVWGIVDLLANIVGVGPVTGLVLPAIPGQ